MAVETAITCPLTLTDGTLAAQVGLAFYTPFVQRIQVALAAIAEYVVNQESSSDANYADRALFARAVILNPQFYAQQMAWAIVADSSTISETCTDQEILNRVWTLFPVASYKASTYHLPGTVGT